MHRNAVLFCDYELITLYLATFDRYSVRALLC